MPRKRVRILRERPVVVLLGMMKLVNNNLDKVYDYYKDRRPDCVSAKTDHLEQPWSMLPHDVHDIPHGNDGDACIPDPRSLTDNEVLCEIAGRSCYASFGKKAGRKTNDAYLQHIWEVGHSSVLYHAKFSFFFGGISRRVSHELIRTYVGSDRSEEGSPSQESTRFTEHTGCFIEPPYIGRLKDDAQRKIEQDKFEETCQRSYDDYHDFIDRRLEDYRATHKGKEPKSLGRKRIYEAASGFLHHSCETSMVWTTNPAAIFKQFMERTDKYSDLEYQRFAACLMQSAHYNAPNLFPPVTWERLAKCRDEGVFDIGVTNEPS